MAEGEPISSPVLNDEHKNTITQISRFSAEQIGNLYQRVSKPLLGHLLLRGMSMENAEDAVQRVFMKILEKEAKEPSYLRPNELEQYKLVFFIGNQVCCDIARREHTVRTRTMPISLLPTDTDAEDCEEIAVNRTFLEEVMSSLEPLDQKIFFLMYLGLSLEEIGDHVGKTMKAIKSRTWRTRGKLDEKFPQDI